MELKKSSVVVNRVVAKQKIWKITDGKAEAIQMEEGKKILLKTFWSSKGWCYRAPTEAELALAKEQRYMFGFVPRCRWIAAPGTRQ